MKINFCLLFFISFGFTHSQEVDLSYVDSLQAESRKKFNASNPEVTFKILNELKEYSLENNYQKGLFNVANYKGNFYIYLDKKDSSIVYFKEALKIAKKHTLKRQVSQVLMNLGALEGRTGNYNDAIKFYLKSLKSAETLKDSMLIARNYENLAIAYQKTSDLKLFEFYLKKSLQFTSENSFDRGVIYTQLGQLYTEQNKFSEAYKNIVEAKKVNELIKEPKLDFYINRIFGLYYEEKKEFKIALGYFEKEATLIKTLNTLDSYIIQNQSHIGFCHFNLGNLQRAESYLTKVYNSLNDGNIIAINNKIYLFTALANIKNEKKPREAFNLLNKVIQLKDSTYASEKIVLSKKLSVEFETEKKDKELAENALEIEKKKSQLWSTIGIAFFLLALCLVLFLVYKLNKQKHKVKIVRLENENELSKLEALLQGEDKERSRVAKDLHDGINGDLSAIKIQLSGLSTDNFSNKEAQIFNQSIGMIDNACEVIRSISHNLAPPAIKDFGWLEAVEKFCYKMNKNYKEEIIFQSYGNNVQFSETTQGHLYRITQELVYNTLKHAKASEVLVQINLNDTSLVLTIEDDGVGFDKTKNYEGIGLKNIESRVAYLDGKWKLEVDKNGTSNNLEFNINKLL